MVDDVIQNIEQKIKILAQRCRDLEAENSMLLEEVEQLKAQKAEVPNPRETVIPSTAAIAEKEEHFQFALKNAKKAKRELEIYLRDMERKIENIKF